MAILPSYAKLFHGPKMLSLSQPVRLNNEDRGQGVINRYRTSRTHLATNHTFKLHALRQLIFDMFMPMTGLAKRSTISSLRFLDVRHILVLALSSPESALGRLLYNISRRRRRPLGLIPFTLIYCNKGFWAIRRCGQFNVSI